MPRMAAREINKLLVQERRASERVHRWIRTKADALAFEHEATPPTWLGRPTRRHNEIIHQVRALRQIATDIHNAIMDLGRKT